MKVQFSLDFLNKEYFNFKTKFNIKFFNYLYSIIENQNKKISIFNVRGIF